VRVREEQRGGFFFVLLFAGFRPIDGAFILHIACPETIKELGMFGFKFLPRNSMMSSGLFNRVPDVETQSQFRDILGPCL
jgi:hypothetical protein